jgi:hypothetical protein
LLTPPRPSGIRRYALRLEGRVSRPYRAGLTGQLYPIDHPSRDRGRDDYCVYLHVFFAHDIVLNPDSTSRSGTKQNEMIIVETLKRDRFGQLRIVAKQYTHSLT